MNTRLKYVQYLRFVAVSLVVVHHCYQIVPLYGRGDFGANFGLGASGVDIFFVISGFIMVAITESREQSPIDFILHRIARVAPMYWLITIIMFIAILISPHLFNSSKADAPSLISSLLFFPWPHATIEGTAPILQIGWTLNYEFIFYLLFALSMYFSKPYRLHISAALLISLVLLGFEFRPQSAQGEFVTSTILIEFVFGLFIGYLFANAKLPAVVSSCLLLILGIVFLSMTVWFPIQRLSPIRPIVWGVPSSLIVLGAVGLEESTAAFTVPILLTLGDASYSIYLTHLFTLGGVRFVWAKLLLSDHVSDIFLLVIGLIASLVVGTLAHRFLERPLVAIAQKARVRAIQRWTKSRQRQLQEF